MNQYGRCLANAKQSVAYLDELDDKKRNRFEKDLKFFQALRKSVRAATPRILISRIMRREFRDCWIHVTATGVEQITKQVNILIRKILPKNWTMKSR